MKYWKEKEANNTDSMKFWQGKFIEKLEPNEVFVFGANPQARHFAGAAKMALKMGAIPISTNKPGIARGLSPNQQTYALITKSLEAGYTEPETGITYDKKGFQSVSPDQIRYNVKEMYETAKKFLEKAFLVTYQFETWPNGTPKKSLNGYTSQEMLEMFVKNQEIPSNIVFHETYKPHLEKLFNKDNKQTNGQLVVIEDGKTVDIKEDDIVWTTDSDESYPEGIHGAGGAKAAIAFGAKFGNGRGLQGSSYALVTKNLNAGFVENSTDIKYEIDGYCSVSESQIRVNVDELYDCARNNPGKNFLITFQYETWPNGSPKKSLNGYTSEEMFQIFVRPNIPSNIVFHDSYKERLEEVLKNNNIESKDYILFLNSDSKSISSVQPLFEDALSTNDFWTSLTTNLSNVKEHTMGAGIALHIKNNFPEAFEADKKTGYGDKNKVGTFSEAIIERNGHKFVVINAYTQYRYGSGKDNFEYESFPSLIQSIISKYGEKKVALPLIGCGLAGGNEPRILKMIRDNLEGVDYKLVELNPTRKLNLGTEESPVKSAEEYTLFFQLNSPFSNFHPSKFQYKEFTFCSNEQFMMFSKAKTFKDEITAQKIIDINHTPLIKDFLEGKISREQIINDESKEWNKLMSTIKGFGREVKNYDDAVWTNKRSKIVLFGAREKFSQNDDLKQALLATNDTLMVEASPYDKIWGIGLSEYDAKKTDPAKWPGLNLLGKVLDTLKVELQNELTKTGDISSKKKALDKPIEVVNFYQIGKQIPEDGVYIGRVNRNFNLTGSKFANPFPMKDQSEEERTRVITEYKDWFWKQMADKQISKQDLMTLASKKLVCYCAPQLCHGNILKETVELLINNEPEFDNKVKQEYKNRVKP